MRKETTLVIVAGGQGSRMWPLTERTPKALLPVRGIPILDRQLAWARVQGVDRIIVCLGHLADVIETHLATVSDCHGLDICVSSEGDAALGTAGAVRLAIDRGLVAGRFYSLYGDTIPALDLGAASKRWDESALAALLCVFRTTSGEYARAQVMEDRVVRFSRYPTASEAPLMTHGDYGIAGFDTSHFAHLSVGARSGFGAIHAALAEYGELAAHEVAVPPTEIGTVRAYELASASDRPAGPSVDGNQRSNR